MQLSKKKKWLVTTLTYYYAEIRSVRTRTVKRLCRTYLEWVISNRISRSSVWSMIVNATTRAEYLSPTITIIIMIC